MAEQNDQQSQSDQQKINPIQIQKFLGGIDYPADKDELCETAERNNAPKDVMQFLERLPEREYNGPNAVSEEIGKEE